MNRYWKTSLFGLLAAVGAVTVAAITTGTIERARPGLVQRRGGAALHHRHHPNRKSVFMKPVLTILLSLLCLTASASPGQPYFVRQQSSSTSSLTIPYSPNLAFWFSSVDLSNSPVASWTDRVSGMVLTQSTAGFRPGWATNTGATFYGTNRMYLTTPYSFSLSPTTNIAVGFVLSGVNDVANPRGVLQCNSYDTFPLLTAHWTGNWRVIGSDYFPVVTSKRIFIMVLASNLNTYIFTNGSYRVVRTLDGALTGSWTNMFTGWAGPGTILSYKGVVKDVFAWTGTTNWGGGHASNIWNWVTNTYGTSDTLALP